jgi:hypothetical protein
MSREMTQPTLGLDALVRDVFQSRFKELCGIVGDFLGPAATHDDIDKCGNSVIAQIVFYQHCKPLLLRMDANLRYDKAGIEELVKHVTRFSLLALQQFRRSLESDSASARKGEVAKPSDVPTPSVATGIS